MNKQIQTTFDGRPIEHDQPDWSDDNPQPKPRKAKGNLLRWIGNTLLWGVLAIPAVILFAVIWTEQDEQDYLEDRRS